MKPLTITLDSNPGDGPGCLKIVASDGRDLLIQTDWDCPGIASSFGWSLVQVQTPGREFGSEDTDRPPCQHRTTDGTVACRDCGIQPDQFIASAREWLDDNDGATVEDPGYFS